MQLKLRVLRVLPPSVLALAIGLVASTGYEAPARAATRPWYSIGAVQKGHCNREYAAAAVYDAMKETQFSATPYVGGFDECMQIASRALKDSGLTSNPTVNGTFVLGANSDTDVAVQCVSYGDRAAVSVFAASMSGNTGAWASSIIQRIESTHCL